MKLGLVGLPSSGKTTLFNAVSGLGRPVGGYSAGPSLDLAAIKVPESRLDLLVEIYSPKKISYTTLDIVDVTGLISGEGRHEVSGEVLGKVRDLDGLGLVLAGFESDSVVHPRGSVDPARDLDLIRTELVFADLSVAENRREKVERESKRGRIPKDVATKELDLLGRVISTLEDGGSIRDLGLGPEDEKLLKGFQFLTIKPEIVIVNTGDIPDEGAGAGGVWGGLPPEAIVIPCALDMELAELDEPERAEFAAEMGVTESASETLCRAAYGVLGLETFFTGGPTEVRAWPMMAGSNAAVAAGSIHTDMERGFIRAEVVDLDDLVEAGTEQAAKAAGKMRAEGREYVVKDGDVLLIRFSV